MEVMKSRVRAEKIFLIVASACSSLCCRGLNQKDRTPGSGGNMQLGGLVESLHLGNTARRRFCIKEFLSFFQHKPSRRLSIWQTASSPIVEAESPFPHTISSILLSIILNFIETAGASWQTQSGCVFPELSPVFLRKAVVLSQVVMINLVVLIQNTEIQAADPVPVFQRFLKCSAVLS